MGVELIIESLPQCQALQQYLINNYHSHKTTLIKTARLLLNATLIKTARLLLNECNQTTLINTATLLWKLKINIRPRASS